MPTTVIVVDAINHEPIGNLTVWSINGMPNPSVNHTVTLMAAAFDADDLATLVCTFTNAGVQRTLEIKIKKDVKLKWEDGGGVFAFDENEEAKYTTSYENPITPWVFIGTNGGKALVANVKPDKGYYAVHDITAWSPDLIINPNSLVEDNQNVLFNYNSVVYDEQIDVFGCTNTHPELKVFVQTHKNFTIEVFRLCESDDDIQVVAKGTENLPFPTTIIISPGPDGTLDRENISDQWLKGDDMLWEDPLHVMHVVAGLNLKAETKILPNNLDCPSVYDFAPTLNTLNSIYGQVSVSADNIAVVDLPTNFDLEEDDNTLTFVEQQSLHQARLSSGDLGDAFTEVYIVKDLGTEVVTILGITYTATIAGRGSGFFLNTLALDRTNAEPSTLPHEVGHAKYGLRHPPGEDNKTADPVDRFRKNFMHNTSTDRVNKIRRYQFHKINKD